MKLFVFGSTGDLVKRKVLIALEKVKEKNLEIICLGRKEMTTQEYLQDHCKECKRDIKYKFINFEDKKLIKNLIKELNEKKINYFYLSLPPKINLLIL
jgi:glucose-6-phosphate 1-dehydrogenase